MTVVRPLKDGVIADFDITEAMLRYFILKTSPRLRWCRPRILICVPSGITEVEKTLEGRGRVLVRYSGTEPKVRVMLEGEDGAEIKRHAADLARLIEQKLG